MSWWEQQSPKETLLNEDGLLLIQGSGDSSLREIQGAACFYKHSSLEQSGLLWMGIILSWQVYIAEIGSWAVVKLLATDPTWPN